MRASLVLPCYGRLSLQQLRANKDEDAGHAERQGGQNYKEGGEHQDVCGSIGYIEEASVDHHFHYYISAVTRGLFIFSWTVIEFAGIARSS